MYKTISLEEFVDFLREYSDDYNVDETTEDVVPDVETPAFDNNAEALRRLFLASSNQGDFNIAFHALKYANDHQINLTEKA